MSLKKPQPQRPTHKRAFAPPGAAQNQLCRVERQLAELKKLAIPDTIQEFVWKLNDLLGSARKVTNYLENESGSASFFRTWVRDQTGALRQSDRRYKHFLELRNVSDKDYIVAPASARAGTDLVATLTLTESENTIFCDPDTGDPVAIFRCRPGAGKADTKVTITKNRIQYYFSGWQEEDILDFLDKVVGTLRDLVDSAYRLDRK